MLISISNDVLCQDRSQAGNRGEQLEARSVDLYADTVDAAFHHIFQALFQGGLINIVLVLSDTNDFRIEFHQFGQRVLQTPANGDSTAHRKVMIRKFCPGCFRGGIY